MKKLLSLLLAVILILPACTTQKGGENMANYLYNGVELPDINTVWTDKETYPYAMVFHPLEDNSIGVLFLVGCDFQLSSNYPETNPQFKFAGGDIAQYYCALNENGVSLLESIGITAGLNEYVLAKSMTASAEGTTALGGYPIWTSHDILNTDGTAYLAASDPVPVGSKLTISTGGSANGDGMALYGGVMLPNIESIWDKAKYPYATVSVWDGMPIVALTSFQQYVSPNELYIVLKDAVLVYAFEDGGYTLGFDGDYPDGTSVFAPADLVWSNHDVIYGDGSTYLSASDPIPLDGMNVITWDGDTTGLETSSNGHYYKVSDEIIDPTVYDKMVVGFTSGGVTAALVGSGSEADVYDNVYLCGLAALVQTGGGSINGITFDSSGVYFFKSEFDDGLMQASLFAYPASSGGVTETTATVNFSCKDLLYTDSVYRIQAWVYKVADGLNTSVAPTWTSELFAGTSHSESHTFTGLSPNTEYEVYGVIAANDVGTEHNATATFTTLGGGLDFSNTGLYVDNPEYTANGADFDIGWTNLPTAAYPNNVQYFISAELDDGTTGSPPVVYIGSSDPAEADSSCWFSFANLEPETEYTVTARLLYNTTGEFSGFTDSGVEATFDFTTLADDLKPVYLRTNGVWAKQTAYERQNGEWVLISTGEV